MTIFRNLKEHIPYRPKPTPVRPPKREDIVRVVMVEKHERLEKGEGLFEVRYMDEKFYLDSVDCIMYMEDKIPNMGVQLMDRLYNFKRLYLNLRTGEITT